MNFREADVLPNALFSKYMDDIVELMERQEPNIDRFIDQTLSGIRQEGKRPNTSINHFLRAILLMDPPKNDLIDIKLQLIFTTGTLL